MAHPVSVAAPTAKGSTLRTTATFIQETAGDAMLERVLARLAPATRALVESVDPTDEVPFETLLAFWQAADALLAPDDPEWIEHAGIHAIESAGLQLYGGILRKQSPLEFLTQGISLFRLYYHPGDMQVVEHDGGTRAVLRLVGFEHGGPLFCRRQTGGLWCALTIAGGTDPVVRHVRCAHEGDAFCEWELVWR